MYATGNGVYHHLDLPPLTKAHTMSEIRNGFVDGRYVVLCYSLPQGHLNGEDINESAHTLSIVPYVRRIGSGMRGKPFFTSMSLVGGGACTTPVVLDAFRNAQEGDVDVRESPKGSEKESKRRSSYGYVLSPSLSIVDYLNVVTVDGGTSNFEFSVHLTGV